MYEKLTATEALEIRAAACEAHGAEWLHHYHIAVERAVLRKLYPSLLVNIGLDAKGGQVSEERAVRALEDNGFIVLALAVGVSDTELTLVAEVVLAFRAQSASRIAEANALYAVALDLDQDCVAAHDKATNTGALLGPRADAWGAFDPSCFINLDGTRLV